MFGRCLENGNGVMAAVKESHAGQTRSGLLRRRGGKHCARGLMVSSGGLSGRPRTCRGRKTLSIEGGTYKISPSRLALARREEEEEGGKIKAGRGD